MSWILITATVLACYTTLSAQAPIRFERVQLSDKYSTEGVTTGDLNHDGRQDLISGTQWWEGPDFQKRHAFSPAKTFGITSYSDRFHNFALDLDGDTWDDVLVIGFPGTAAYWFQNPKNPASTAAWKQHRLHSSVGAESPRLLELVGGGLPELLCTTGTQLGYLKANPTLPTQPWSFHPITGNLPFTPFLHGLGAADINGDGRLDVLTVFGWLEQPTSLANDPQWALHLVPFSAGIGGAQMFGYDVDGDSDTDVVTSIHAHGYGLSWFEQALINGKITFVEHVILPPTNQAGLAVQFSQLHGVDLVDLDGDGLKDIVTGKTFMAHNGIDPGANDPAVLYWFRLQRSGGTVTFTPHLIDDDSGVGRQVFGRDVDGDGRKDVLVGNKKGVFIFAQKRMWADVDRLPLKVAGSQKLNLDAGQVNATQPYWILGTVTGIQSGVTVLGRHLPFIPDFYTDFTVLAANSTMLQNFNGVLDTRGKGAATFNLPPGLPPLAGFTMHHVCIVFDSQGAIRSVSHLVPLTLF